MTPARARLLGGVLSAVPNIAAAAGLATYFVQQGTIPKSLAVALGSLAPAYMVLIIAAVVAAGVFAIPQRVWWMQAEAAVRPVAAACLASYAVAVSFSGATPTPAWITAGFALALALEQVRRWHSLVTVFLPEMKAVRTVIEERGL